GSVNIVKCAPQITRLRSVTGPIFRGWNNSGCAGPGAMQAGCHTSNASDRAAWQHGEVTEVRSPEPTEEDADYDPFAVFDEAVGIGTVRDPHAVFHELRSECPVQAGPINRRFGVDAGIEDMLLGSDSTPHTVL